MPYLSACLIVRDESPRIATCLAALRDWVDEVVVHDTGSSDDTVPLALQAGARVYVGAWPNSFAAARNAALAHATGEWVVSLDADEVLTGDPESLRAQCRSTSNTADALTVEITNTQQSGSYTHPAVRVFRRRHATWVGGAHEQVVYPGRAARAVPAQGFGILHHGYSNPDTVADKSRRNAALLERELPDATAKRAPRLLLDLGRSYIGAGRTQDAVDALTRVRELAAGTPLAACAADHLARILAVGGHPGVAVALAEETRPFASAAYTDALAGTALLHLGQPARAAELLHVSGPLRDTGGRTHSPAAYLELGALAALITGDVQLGWERAERAIGAGADPVALAAAAIPAARQHQSVSAVAASLQRVVNSRLTEVRQALESSGSPLAGAVAQELSAA